MQVAINESPWVKTLVGLSKTHDPALSYGDEIRAVLAPVWEVVRRDQIAVTGINHVLYGEGNEVFCGLEFRGAPVPVSGLELRQVRLDRYANTCHAGPYDQIPEAYTGMRAEVERLGLRPILPGMEIYGHWNDDPQKLVTEIFVSVA